MKLIAKKPCSFRGEKFYIGDEIPVELVLNPKEQEKMGVLTIANEIAPAAEALTMEVLIHAEKGDLPLNVTKEGLQTVVDVLTSNVDGAESIIKQMDDEDALILLHNVDGRKAVKAAAGARAKELSPEEAGEQ